MAISSIRCLRLASRFQRGLLSGHNNSPVASFLRPPKQVAMIAITGILVQSLVRFPGFPPFPVSDPARPLAVLKRLLSSEPNSVLLFLLVVGAVELTIGKQVCVCVPARVMVAFVVGAAQPSRDRSTACYHRKTCGGQSAFVLSIRIH